MSIRVGFIGLGNQGKPIAAHLAPAGFETTVYDIVKAPVDELVAAGAKAAATPREVGANADLIGICVPEDAHVRAVVLGEDGLLTGMTAGGVILIHSTVLPDTALEVAEAAAAKSVAVLDACVTGGSARAANKQLTYLVGGPDAAFEKARPYFEATTDIEPIHAGELGNGAKLKLCVNLTTYIQWAAAYEPMILARAIGLPQEILEKAGRSNGQLTDMMISFLGGHKLPEEVRKSDDFQRLMGSHMKIGEKDLAWALQLARQAGVSLPVGALVSQSMARLYGVEDDQRR
ncbi:MAG: NAD(P)-dependent oxidoreductase [Deltaproteobacteria bacterium]|nr:NAD(P)-dependent oxidoreductase [Deltaproteobacteria bacterium]MBW2359322.1 NAD(P)-dependent oxidoreductase [Deltaproteobacteria bacterium]